MAKEKRPRGTGRLFQRVPGFPWTAQWYEHGRRRTRSTETTDRALAEQIMAKWIGAATMTRFGVVDAASLRQAEESRRPLSEIIKAYVEHCECNDQSKDHIRTKRATFKRFMELTRAERLSDITAESVVSYLKLRKEAGVAPVTRNGERRKLVSLMSWCVNEGRIASNPLKFVPIADERKGRKRLRRALTDEELSRLLTIAEQFGRRAWYLTALHAGLRRSELIKLKWSDVDFREMVIVVREGKAKREDTLAMHPELADELQSIFDQRKPASTDRVFPEQVTGRTQLLDFYEAGLAQALPVVDKDGKPVMIGKGERRRQKVRYDPTNADGRRVDLHALRTTLVTRLARAGVTPQVAQRAMRHSDYRTTMKHYNGLSLADTTAAINRLASVGNDAEPARQRATGTLGQVGPANAVAGGDAQKRTQSPPVSNSAPPSRLNAAGYYVGEINEPAEVGVNPSALADGAATARSNWFITVPSFANPCADDSRSLALAHEKGPVLPGQIRNCEMVQVEPRGIEPLTPSLQS